MIQRLDPCFLPYSQSLEMIRRRFPKGRFEWMPFGVDDQVFAPYDDARPIFAYWMGRRYEPLHEKIQEYCARRGLVYRFSSDGEIVSPIELGHIVGSAKYFVVTPPDLDQFDRTNGVSPLVMRYLEGLSAGAKLLGVLPRSGEYERMLPMGAILSVSPDGSDLEVKLDSDRESGRDEEFFSEVREFVISRHSWKVRAEQIYRRLKTGNSICETEYFLN